MSPLTHLVGSWLIASAASDHPRDRRLITLAGILPDADGLGILVDAAKAMAGGGENTFHYYQQYHHYLLHGWPGALAVAAVLGCFARQRGRVMLLCLLTFHMHLICDLLGSRGPSPGDLWPIAYSEPVFRHPVWFWRGQWQLDGWQNKIIFVTLFSAALWVAAAKGASFLEVFNRRLDAVVAGVLRKWKTQLVGGKSSS